MRIRNRLKQLVMVFAKEFDFGEADLEIKERRNYVEAKVRLVKVPINLLGKAEIEDEIKEALKSEEKTVCLEEDLCWNIYIKEPEYINEVNYQINIAENEIIATTYNDIRCYNCKEYEDCDRQGRLGDVCKDINKSKISFEEIDNLLCSINDDDYNFILVEWEE